jgi:hypothetical protein
VRGSSAAALPGAFSSRRLALEMTRGVPLAKRTSRIGYVPENDCDRAFR